jgi:hypothetical protein
MSSIFGRIKRKLRQDFGGRYLGIILEQVIQDAPKFARVTFPNLPQSVTAKLRDGRASLSTEVEFLGRFNRRRRADLAICEGGDILALAEIKYEDHLSAENYAQIEDYLWFVNSNSEVFFTYLTQHAPPEDDRLLIEMAASPRIKHLYFRDIHRAGKAFNETAVKWLIEFLEEEHVVYQEDLGGDAEQLIKLLMVRGLNLPHKTKLGRLRTRSNLIGSVDLLQTLTGNLVALSDWFYEQFREHFGNRFTPNFAFEPTFRISVVKKELHQSSKLTSSLWPDAKTGGDFWVEGSGRIKTKGTDMWLYLAFGLKFSLELSPTPELRRTVFAAIYGREGIWSYKERPITHTVFSLPEAKAQALIASTVDTALAKVLKDELPAFAQVPLQGLHRAVRERFSSRSPAAREPRVIRA